MTAREKNVMILLVRHPYHSIFANACFGREELHCKYCVSSLFELSYNLIGRIEHNSMYGVEIVVVSFPCANDGFIYFKQNMVSIMSMIKLFFTISFICKT